MPAISSGTCGIEQASYHLAELLKKSGSAIA